MRIYVCEPNDNSRKASSDGPAVFTLFDDFFYCFLNFRFNFKHQYLKWKAFVIQAYFMHFDTRIVLGKGADFTR